LLAFVEAHPDRIGQPGLDDKEFRRLVSLDRQAAAVVGLGLSLPGGPDHAPSDFHFSEGTNRRYHKTHRGIKLSPTPEWLAAMRALGQEAKALTIEQAEPSTPAEPAGQLSGAANTGEKPGFLCAELARQRDLKQQKSRWQEDRARQQLRWDAFGPLLDEIPKGHHSEREKFRLPPVVRARIADALCRWGKCSKPKG
jgi:hypothetical protein